jgi:hypothetical protein
LHAYRWRNIPWFIDFQLGLLTISLTFACIP